MFSCYLRDAGVGEIPKVAEQRLSVIGANGGGGVRQDVMVEQALPEELVEESRGISWPQRTSEPGVLDRDVHCDSLFYEKSSR